MASLSEDRGEKAARDQVLRTALANRRPRSVALYRMRSILAPSSAEGI
jgi:hypothetical protein